MFWYISMKLAQSCLQLFMLLIWQILPKLSQQRLPNSPGDGLEGLIHDNYTIGNGLYTDEALSF